MRNISKGLVFIILVAALLIPLNAIAKEKSIVVGGKDYTEQQLLPELASILLQDAGMDVDVKTGVGTAIARKSLEN